MKKIVTFVSLFLISACGNNSATENEVKYNDDPQRIIVDDIVFYVWPSSRENYVRVARSETEAIWANPDIVDLLDYQDRFLAEAARKATSCEVDLEGSSMTERTCVFCTPQYYAKLVCEAKS